MGTAVGRRERPRYNRITGNKQNNMKISLGWYDGRRKIPAATLPDAEAWAHEKFDESPLISGWEIRHESGGWWVYLKYSKA